MQPHEKNPVIAIIDIGSNALNLEIYQLTNNKIVQLENLVYPISLGKDTFTIGKISFEKVNKTCEIINNFIAETKTYGNDVKVTAIATTAVREADNCDFVLDRIKNVTGVFIKLLLDSSEKTLIYKEIFRRLKASKKSNSTALIVYAGIGNLGVSVYTNGTLSNSQNIRVGSLRLSEILLELADYDNNNGSSIDDFLRSFGQTFYNNLPDLKINDLIVSGRQIGIISKMCNATVNEDFLQVEKTVFRGIYNSLTGKTVAEIAEEFHISTENAELVRPAMGIYNMFLDVSKSSYITMPLVSATNMLIFETLQPKEYKIFNAEFDKNTLISATALANRYDYDEKHSNYVEKYCLEIFDKTKKFHCLNKRERLYLQVSAILHDIGKYINISSHYLLSHQIIKSSYIVGLDAKELEIIANVCKYHSYLLPDTNDYEFSKFSKHDQMVISKLTSILRVAESLEKGHKGKFSNFQIKIKENTLSVNVYSSQNTQIEEWSFEKNKKYFEEIFALKLVIKKKR